MCHFLHTAVGGLRLIILLIHAGGGGGNSLKKMCLPSKVGHLKRESFFFQIMSETLPMTYEFLMKL